MNLTAQQLAERAADAIGNEAAKWGECPCPVQIILEQTQLENLLNIVNLARLAAWDLEHLGALQTALKAFDQHALNALGGGE